MPVSRSAIPDLLRPGLAGGSGSAKMARKPEPPKDDDEDEYCAGGATPKRRKSGGRAEGERAGGRLDHRARGGGFHPGGKKGKLHREMGIPTSEKIPAGRLEKAAHSSDPEIRRDAIRAETMKKWKHG